MFLDARGGASPHPPLAHVCLFYFLFQGMVKQLSSGLCLVLEISLSSSSGDESSVSSFRDLVGPPDPDLARKLRPGSLRARHGGKNSVSTHGPWQICGEGESSYAQEIF